MRVFVTGATGLIGTAVTRELQEAGHQVAGLARSARSEEILRGRGVQPVLGGLADLDALGRAAAQSDGVIHLAFNHDFSDFPGAIRSDMAAVQAIGAALEGSGKPFVSATSLPSTPGRAVTEDEDPIDSGANARVANARAVRDLARSGVRASVVRLPHTVYAAHGHGGFTEFLIRMARRAGVAGFIGDGSSRWAAVPVADAARLFRIALEDAEPGSALHAVLDEGIPMRDLARVIGDQLGVPARTVEPAELGFLQVFAGLDEPASSRRTRERYGWTPTGTPLLETLEQGIDPDLV